MPKNREKRKRGRRFFDHETTETFDDGTPSIHTDTRHQHHHHGFYYCFKYRSRRGIICESSFSLVFLSLSLSLSLSARANASRPCEQIIYSAFLSISEKMYSHTGATPTTTTTANQSCLSRVRTADVLSLHEASARANGDYR